MKRKQNNPNVTIFIIYGLLFDAVVNLWKPFSAKFLERLGGGGSQATAGLQVKGKTVTDVIEELKQAIDLYLRR